MSYIFHKLRIMSNRRTILTIFLIIATTAVKAQSMIPLNEDHWEVLSDQGTETDLELIEYMGSTSLVLNGTSTRSARIKGISYKNFKMSLDIAGTVMPGVGFRIADPYNYELFYLRTFSGGKPDASQYTPLINGTLNWKFYYDEPYEHAVDVNKEDWHHVELIVMENNLKVYVNDSPTPQMDVVLQQPHLNAGGVWLETMFGPGYFKDITITELTDEGQPVDPYVRNPDFIIDWEISEQFELPNKKDFESSIDIIESVQKWTAIEDESSQVVNLGKYYEHPNGFNVVRRNFYADSDTTVSINFNYCGKFMMIHRGETLYDGENSDFERLIGTPLSVKVDLKKGDNMIYIITEGDNYFFKDKGWMVFGRKQHQNWGFQATVSEYIEEEERPSIDSKASE